MPGSIVTLRTAGVTAGYPAPIDTDIKVRSVDDLLINMRDNSTDLLKLCGGPSSFTFNNTTHEWTTDDLWNRRITGCTCPGGADPGVLTVTGIAFRFPIGTLFKVVSTAVILRVIAITDANTLSVVNAGGAGNVAAILDTQEVKVSGQAMAANAAWLFRPGAILGMAFNYGQVMSEGLEVTYDRMETALHSLGLGDLDYLAANCVQENFIKLEGTLLDGERFAGSAANYPARAGGVKYYVTAANGAVVTDLAGVALTRKDLDDALQTRLYAVGPEKMARTVLCSAWAKRKVSSWFSSAERVSSGAGLTAGVAVDRINTDFGVIEFLLHTSLDQNEILLLNRENIKMGCHGNLGRPHLIIPTSVSVTGPYMQRFYYAHVTASVKGVEGMGRIHNFSVAA